MVTIPPLFIVVISSPNILNEHCVIINNDGFVVLEPFPDAACSVNGVDVNKKVRLQQGEEDYDPFRMFTSSPSVALTPDMTYQSLHEMAIVLAIDSVKGKTVFFYAIYQLSIRENYVLKNPYINFYFFFI